MAANRASGSQAKSGSFLKLWLIVPYAILVFASFATGNTYSSNTGSRLEAIFRDTAITFAVAAAVCGLSDYFVCRPRRWVLAICFGVGFTIGWTNMGGNFALPIITSTVAYVVAALVTRYLPPVNSVTGFGMPAPDRLKAIGLLVICLAIPLTIAQLVASSSHRAGASVRNMIVDLHTEAFPWYATLMDWTGAMSRLTASGGALWIIPLCLAGGVLYAWDDGPNSRFSRFEALVLAVVIVGVVLALVAQWSVAVIFTTFIGLFLIVLGVGILIVTGLAS